MDQRLSTLKQLSMDLKTLEDVSGLLDWDMQTYMPAKGGAARAEHQALIQSLIHEKVCSQAMRKALKPLVKAGAIKMSLGDRALVREMWKRHSRERKIPKKLVEEMARLDSMAFQKWTAAREKGDFHGFAPFLRKQVAVKRRLADHIGYKQSPYDALLDLFEPGATAIWVEEVFNDLKEDLVPLVKKIAQAPHPPSTAVLEQPYEVGKQWDFGLKILHRMGFDFEAGRQDKSVHPFTASCGGVGDVRITTRMNPKDLRPGLFGTLHEGGHALYEQGFGKAVQNSILGTGASCALHESQSRLWENMVGRGQPFWKYWFPRLKRFFPDRLKRVNSATFYRAVNKVVPSFIRVEADEVTYALHIILRFEIERDLIEGRIKVKEVSDIWNTKMKIYLGIKPPDDRLGVLQDVHWSCGYFGYFPSYALGNLYAAQFYAAASREIPDLEKQIARGNLLCLLNWLRNKIHRHGKIFHAQELVLRVTKKPLSTEAFMKYLTGKFGSLYSV